MPPKKGKRPNYKSVASKGSKRTTGKTKSGDEQAKAAAAISTRVDQEAGAHVTTVVTSNEATAEEPVNVEALPDPEPIVEAPPEPTVAPQLPSDAEDLLELGREIWNDADADPNEERMVVIKYSHYNKEFPCRGPHGCLRWRDVDDEYCLSFAFAGDFGMRVRQLPEGADSSVDPELTALVHQSSLGELGAGEDGERDRALDEIYFFLGDAETTGMLNFCN